MIIIIIIIIMIIISTEWTLQAALKEKVIVEEESLHDMKLKTGRKKPTWCVCPTNIR